MLDTLDHAPHADEAEIKLVHIPAEHVGSAFPAFKHLVPSVVERSGGAYDTTSLMESLMSGELQLWVAWDGDIILAIMGLDIGVAPSGLICANIRFATGEQSHRWVHLIDAFEPKLREQGVQRVRILARKGWARKLPDYHLTHIYLEKAL